MPEFATHTDAGENPGLARFLGLAASITAGIGTIAAEHGITLTSVESHVEADAVRDSYQRVRINFTITGDAPRQQLRQIVEQSRIRSAVSDAPANGVPVAVTVTTRQRS